jgi:hypothetical protein
LRYHRPTAEAFADGELQFVVAAFQWEDQLVEEADGAEE